MFWVARGTQLIRGEGSSQGKGRQRGTEGEEREKGTRLGGKREITKKGRKNTADFQRIRKRAGGHGGSHI